MIMSQGEKSAPNNQIKTEKEVTVIDEVKGSSYTNLDETNNGNSSSDSNSESNSEDNSENNGEQKEFKKEEKVKPNFAEKANINFLENKTSIVQTPEFSSYLDSLSNLLNQTDKYYVHLVGHTSTTSGIKVDNHAIGLKRAEHVKSLLTKRGVDPSKISVESKGSDHPAEEGETAEARKKNRRVELFLKSN